MCVTIQHVLFCTQIYERRAKQVRDREQDYWKDVTPDMMSDEEKQGDVFIRHQPSYRSTNFTKFLNKLDQRAAAKSSHQPRASRELGSPAKKPIPPMCKQWMIKPELRKGQNEIDQEPDSSASELDSSASEFDEEAN